MISSSLRIFLPRHTLAALLPLALLLSGCAGLVEFSAGDASAPTRYINGTIVTGPMAKMPTLEQRGVRRIGLIVDMKPESSLESVGLTLFGNRTSSIPGPAPITDADIVSLYREAFTRSSAIALVDLSAEKAALLPHLRVSSWDGRGSLAKESAVEARLAALRQEGINTIMFVREQRLPDFIGFTNQILEVKGLYHRLGSLHAYGGFDIRLIDVATRKELPHTAYVQAGSVALAIAAWKPKYEQYTDEERRLITDGLREVFALNVAESLTMLKAAKK